MRDRDAGLAAARAALEKMPQYRNQQQSPQPDPNNPFAPQPQQPQSQMDFGGGVPQDPAQFQLAKLYHMLSGLSYEMYGDPNKWQEGHIEAFFEDIKSQIKRGKSLNTSKMKAMLKKR